MSDFPSSKFERGRIIAKTGLKVGTNYAQRYLKKRITGKEKSAKSSILKMHVRYLKSLPN